MILHPDFNNSLLRDFIPKTMDEAWLLFDYIPTNTLFECVADTDFEIAIELMRKNIFPQSYEIKKMIEHGLTDRVKFFLTFSSSSKEEVEEEISQNKFLQACACSSIKKVKKYLNSNEDLSFQTKNGVSIINLYFHA